MPVAPQPAREAIRLTDAGRVSAARADAADCLLVMPVS
ncbi:hypothetical protein BURCENBC7_AP3083 [Burkholderia cenocepacia BC7]|nr:uncharacterized protein BCN122_II1191 [Burkholderia cenocepacia]EPZ90299.1 hypothetical protein BURCENK562V_C3215 [Burkholderia cenocepacia K56-2Valvano]ERI32240.1 hypothetical protein BURCENBC7_AP3083 [Burkholderia cenocepacia BC7]